MFFYDKDGDSNYYIIIDGESVGESGIFVMKFKIIFFLQENYGGMIELLNELNILEDKGNLRKRDDNVIKGIRLYFNLGICVNLEGVICDFSKDYKIEVVVKVLMWKLFENLSENKEENKISVEFCFWLKSEFVISEMLLCKRRNVIMVKGVIVLFILFFVWFDDRFYRLVFNGFFKKVKEILSVRNLYDLGGFFRIEDEKDM